MHSIFIAGSTSLAEDMTSLQRISLEAYSPRLRFSTVIGRLIGEGNPLNEESTKRLKNARRCIILAGD
jgi:hypothetical protein